MNTSEEEWKKEFDRKFAVYFDNVGRPTPTSYAGWIHDDIKSFISSLLTKAKQDTLKEVGEMLWGMKSERGQGLARGTTSFDIDSDDAIDTLLSKLDKL